MGKRVYDKIRSIIERNEGIMRYVRKDYKFGAWEITMNGVLKVIVATGEKSFPELDELYSPKIIDPVTYDDYSNNLIPEAEERIISWFQKM